MPDIRIITEDVQEDYLSILLKGDEFLHFVVTSTSEILDSDAFLYKSTNKIKIHVRNLSYDNFRYEAMAHHLLNHVGISHKHFSIQAFDSMDDFVVFESFIFALNRYFGSNFIVEHDKNGFLIEKDSEIILQSFL